MEPVDYYQKYKKYKIMYINSKQYGASKPKLFYHGSQNIITDYLNPYPSDIIDNEPAVFATNTKWLSILFISDARHNIESGFINNKPYILEQHSGAFDKYLKNESGYIYYVDSKKFKSNKRLGLQGYEFISSKPVKIIKNEFVPDLFEALKKTKVNIFTFDDKINCIDKLIDSRNRNKK